MMNCSRTNNLLQFLIMILKKAGGLQRDCEIDMFMLKNYPIDSIENISLMFAWKHVYNSKYNNISLLGIPFAYAYSGLVTITTHMSLPMSLDFELKRNNNAQNWLSSGVLS